MGFDLSGLNPQENTPLPEIVTKWQDEDGWVKWKEMESVKGESVKYFEALEKWKKENPGDYFRANVWYWRPLWEYVCNVCDDILTEEDMESGTYNDGHEIVNEKALSIADRLETLYYDGNILKHEIERESYLKGLDKEICTTCDGTGQRNEEWLEDDVKGKCNGCNGEGERENWQTHYPFKSDIVLEFAQFCKQSGGFTIC